MQHDERKSFKGAFESKRTENLKSVKNVFGQSPSSFSFLNTPRADDKQTQVCSANHGPCVQ